MTPPTRAPRRLAALALSFLASGCFAPRLVMDPTLIVETAGGVELGVSTDYGVVFLGRTARSGDVQVVAWFGDGPSIEASVIEPLGDGLYTLETEIRLPSVAMAFFDPRPGDEVRIAGRRGAEPWEVRSEVLTDPRVEGILLRVPSSLDLASDQVGAGVYVRDEELDRPLLLGLVSGRLQLTGPDGGSREYLTVVGPTSLWRLVTHQREFPYKRRWVYREDIL